MAPDETQKIFLRAYDDYADAIFRHCYFRVFNREQAKDLMQETFVKTWEYLDRGPEIKNIRAFLYKVANNLIIDDSRKQKTGSLDEMRETGFDPAGESGDRAQTSAEIKTIIETLKKLEPDYREVIVMRFIDNLGPKEIAETLGETENSVSVRINRAIKQLREKFVP